MTSVLITRPTSSAKSLAHELERLGYHPVIFPLLTIRPTGVPCPSTDLKAVMITSGNALDTLVLDRNTEFILSLPCFCVGTHTTEKATSFGFSNVYNASGDSRQLADLIHKTLPTGTPTILHIAGTDISPHTHTDILARGYHLVLWHVYQAVPVSILDEKIIKAIHQNQLDVVLVYSPRTAEILCKLIMENELQPFCKQLTAIGLSKAVLDSLKTMPWKQCIAASTPSEDKMITCLQETCPATRGSYD